MSQDPNQVQVLDDAVEVRDKKTLPDENTVDPKMEEAALGVLVDKERADVAQIPEKKDESGQCRNVWDEVRRYEEGIQSKVEVEYDKLPKKSSSRDSSWGRIAVDNYREFVRRLNDKKVTYFIELIDSLKGTVSDEAWRIKLYTFLNPKYLNKWVAGQIYGKLKSDESEFALQIELYLIESGFVEYANGDYGRIPFWNKIKGKNTDYANKIRAGVLRYAIEKGGKNTSKFTDLINGLEDSITPEIKDSLPSDFLEKFEPLVNNESRTCYKVGRKVGEYRGKVADLEKARNVRTTGMSTWDLNRHWDYVHSISSKLQDPADFYIGLMDDLKGTVSDEAWNLKLKTFLDPKFLTKENVVRIYKKLEKDESEFALQIELHLIKLGYVTYYTKNNPLRYAFWDKINGNTSDYANKIRAAILEYISGMLGEYSEEADNIFAGLTDTSAGIRKSLPPDLHKKLDRVGKIIYKNIDDHLDKEEKAENARKEAARQEIIKDMREVLDGRLADTDWVYAGNESDPDDRLHVISYIFHNVDSARDINIEVEVLEKLMDFLAKWQEYEYYRKNFQPHLHSYLSKNAKRFETKEGKSLLERLNKLADEKYFSEREREINKDHEFKYVGYSYKRKRK